MKSYFCEFLKEFKNFFKFLAIYKIIIILGLSSNQSPCTSHSIANSSLLNSDKINFRCDEAKYLFVFMYL